MKHQISSRFPCLFCGFSFLIPTRLPVPVTGVFCCQIFLACVTGEMLYCDFKAAANLNITNMQTLGFTGHFLALNVLILEEVSFDIVMWQCLEL